MKLGKMYRAVEDLRDGIGLQKFSKGEVIVPLEQIKLDPVHKDEGDLVYLSACGKMKTILVRVNDMDTMFELVET